MMRQVSLPLRRALALTILLGLVAAAWLFVASPLLGMSADRRDEIAALSEQLATLQAFIARQPELSRRAALEQSALATEGGLWSGGSPSEVAAKMQDRLRRAVADHAGQLRSTAVVATTEDHGFRRVTVHFSVAGTLNTVQGALAAAQSARPAMFVDNLSIHATGAGGMTEPPQLTMDLDVSAYMAMAGA